MSTYEEMVTTGTDPYTNFQKQALEAVTDANALLANGPRTSVRLEAASVLMAEAQVYATLALAEATRSAS